jgi:transcription antitermination factor NusG
MLQAAGKNESAAVGTRAEAERQWFAVRVKPNCEKVSAAGLAARGVEYFLPTTTEKRRWSDRVKVSEFPLFPGYLFCRMDPDRRAPLVLGTPGVIGIVSSGAQLLPVTEEEIEAVRRSVAASVDLKPWPFLTTGHRVRVTRGALAGVEGLVVQQSNTWRLVLQISLLQRSVSLEIDRDAIEPIKSTAMVRP